MAITERIKSGIKHGWNAFKDGEKEVSIFDHGQASSINGNYKVSATRYSASSYTAAIFNRIALDASLVSIMHVKINKENEDQTDMVSGLQNCLSVEANTDQSHLAFIQDIVYSMFDEGVVAVVPIETSIKPSKGGGYDIHTMRVGRITQWYPQHVRVKLYDERTGVHEEIVVPKSTTAIIENPLYSVVNDTNATFKRLIAKIGMLDDVDATLAAGKLDLIIQLPHAVKSELQKTQADERIQKIEDQLGKKGLGIVYTDATEKVIQLNRPINPSLADDIATLTKKFYNEIGLTENVFNGTASESEMRGYYTRTVDPVIAAIISEFVRKFLTKTARSQGQTLISYRDPFKLVPIDQVAEIGDKFIRNRIVSGNEMRKIVGMRPRNEPEMDLIYNPNMPVDDQPMVAPGSPTSPEE